MSVFAFHVFSRCTLSVSHTSAQSTCNLVLKASAAFDENSSQMSNSIHISSVECKQPSIMEFDHIL